MKNYPIKSLCCILILAAFPAYAEFDVNKDKNEKAYISSDTADLNRTTGVGVYRVDVKIDQGSTHVRGDVVTTYTDANNKLKEAIIVGKEGELASYETLIETGKPVLYAKAKTIKFYPQKNYIILIGNASIIQGTDSIQGDQLEYDIEKQHLIAKGNDSSKGKNRTTIVILPKGEGGGNFVMNTNGKKS